MPSRNLAEGSVVPLPLPGDRTALPPPSGSLSVPGRKEEAGPEHRAITGCAGAQWEAVAGERIVSHHSDPWREKQERRMLCLLVTSSNSPSLFLQPWQLQGCRPFWQSPSFPRCSVPVSAPPEWLCHFWVTDIDQDCSLNSGG